METLNNTAPQADVIIIEPTESALQILDKREAELIALREELKVLIIKGPDDNEGYKAVREGRLKAKKARTSLRADGKSLRDSANKFCKTVLHREDELVDIVEPEECRLREMEEAFEEEQERRRIEEERKEQKRIQDRIDQLRKFNYEVDAYEAKTMPEENFQALLGHAEAEFNKEQERIAKAKSEEEAARIAEQDRLRIERENLEKQQADLKRQQEAFEEQKRANEAVLREERERNEKAAREEREKIEAEKLTLQEAKFNHRKQSLLSIGLITDGKTISHQLFNLQVAESTVRNLDDSAFDLFLVEAKETIARETEAKAKREADELAERERKAEEDRKRQEALAPDKEKLFGFGMKVMEVITAEFPDPASLSIESNELLSNFIGQLKAACDEFGHKVNSL